MKGSNSSSEDAVFQQLDDLKEEDPSSVVVLKHDENFSIQSIFFQTSFMRNAFLNYPELLVMDTTYSLCNNDMPLIVFEVIDCFGAGRVAGYALISSEKKETVSEALGVLQVGCQESMSKVNVVMIDRDQSEIAAVVAMRSSGIKMTQYYAKMV